MTTTKTSYRSAGSSVSRTSRTSPLRAASSRASTDAARHAPEGTRLAGRSIDDDQFDGVEALERFAEERNHTLHELAIAALASTPGIGSVIAGATKPEQVRANAAAASWKLTDEDVQALRDLTSDLR